MVDVVNKFGINWKCGKAKTNNLFLVDDENSYNTSKMWFMLVLDKNDNTQYLAFHNTSTNKSQIRTHITTSTYSNRQKLYEIPNIEINRNASRTDYDVVFLDKDLYAIPSDYIDIIEKIDPNLSIYIQKFKNNISVQEYFIKKVDNAGFGRKSYNQIAEWSVQKNGKIYFYYVPKKNGNLKLCLPLDIKLGDMPQGVEKDISLGQKGNYTYPEKYPLRIDFIDCNLLEVKEFLDNILEQLDIFSINAETNFNNTKQYEDKKMQVNIPLNQILYGPPGTGKTYSIRKYIDEILGKNPGLNIENEDQRINNVVKDSNWYSAIALSMYQNGKNNKYKVAELLEQKIIKAFSLTRENKNVRAALWAQMQIHTNENCPNVNYSNRLAPFIFEKNENSEWYLTEDGIKFVEENLSEQLEQLSAKNNTRKLEDFYKFLTFHQSYSYEEFVEGIKPQIRTDEECSYVSYEYNKGIFKEICQQANSDPDNNYLLIIDEINRGNISKIFGELITLIEIDKRVVPNGERIFENTITKDEQLLVTLPYTKSKFGVPSNLYILGTMNTSDRSIASIDIALRRRFKFVEMMPNSDLVSDFECNFREIFEKLNTKIKILLDRDHQIGHSYFIRTKYANADIGTLKEIWFSEIIPLLNEYFYCDWEKLKLIIPGFIKEIK
ncbi:AAA family ATPase, partial [bacterium]|nr:AAA family ATPase [bacterium]